MWQEQGRKVSDCLAGTGKDVPPGPAGSSPQHCPLISPRHLLTCFFLAIRRGRSSRGVSSVGTSVGRSCITSPGHSCVPANFFQLFVISRPFPKPSWPLAHPQVPKMSPRAHSTAQACLQLWTPNLISNPPPWYSVARDVLIPSCSWYHPQ